MPPIAKYGLQYLFVQAEFGLMCPVSVSDTSNFVILRYGSDELKRKLVPRLLSQDPAAMWKGTQFMTEKSGGSDVGALESEARAGKRRVAALRREMVLLAHRRRPGT